jgi:hypothetical protein
MLFPALLVVLFGSQVINVMNAQRSMETMEQKYKLKISKLDEIIRRVRDGEIVNVQKELKLVNKVFSRSAAQFSVMGQKGSSSQQVKMDGLSDLSKIFDEVMDEVMEEDNAKEVKQSTQAREVIKKDIEEIHQHMQKEKELTDYKLDPKQHLIVETPGDYVGAARDTKVTKFL